jgi:hypothetical protein
VPDQVAFEGFMLGSTVSEKIDSRVPRIEDTIKISHRISPFDQKDILKPHSPPPRPYQ